MKYLVTLLRIFIGILFIFSGLIKSNDPTGFSYKLDEYFSVFAADLETEQDSILFELTGLDGTQSLKTSLDPNIPQLQLVAKTTDWVMIPIDSDTTYLATASIQFAGNEIYSTDLNASDTGEALEKFTAKASLEGTELLNKEIVFKGIQENNIVETIDTKPYVKANSWLVDFMEYLRNYALALAIFVCVVEILLGIALLIGWAPKFTLWMLILMLLFFGFLTFYSAQYDKVTDCGCFGDAIKLTPWQSFYKDLIFLISVIIIFIGRKYLKPIFSNPFSVRLLTVFALLSTGFALYCWHYLPVKNFLKF